MPIIPLMSYNVFTVMDETYWTGYPTAETAPYTDPVPNWGNSRVHDGQAEADAVMATLGKAGVAARLRPLLCAMAR